MRQHPSLFHDGTSIRCVGVLGVQFWVIPCSSLGFLTEEITDTKTKECSRGRAGGGERGWMCLGVPFGLVFLWFPCQRRAERCAEHAQ